MNRECGHLVSALRIIDYRYFTDFADENLTFVEYFFCTRLIIVVFFRT